MYITALKTICPQSTYDDSFFKGNYTVHTGNKYKAQEPDYNGIISPNLLRRMGKSIRIGIGAALPLIKSRENIDAIIIASSEGGQEESIKFLNQIVEYKEGSLTPTNFLQSTPNALAGSLALMTQNTCYNITHVHKGHAFENALIDASILFGEEKTETILVGNVEEISDYNYNIEYLAGKYKTENTTSANILSSNTPGTVCGEGSSMFILEKNANEYLAKIVDVEQISFPTEREIHGLIKKVLDRNGLKPADIDSLILGFSGDNRTDFWYRNLTRKIFPGKTFYTFKDLVGEYPTATGFATFLGTCLISGKVADNASIKYLQKPPKNILIYNHYNGEQHGLILMSA